MVCAAAFVGCLFGYLCLVGLFLFGCWHLHSVRSGVLLFSCGCFVDLMFDGLTLIWFCLVWFCLCVIAWFWISCGL